MHEIRVSIMSPEAADRGVAELWFADDLSSARAASLKRSLEPSTYSNTPNARSRA